MIFFCLFYIILPDLHPLYAGRDGPPKKIFAPVQGGGGTGEVGRCGGRMQSGRPGTAGTPAWGRRSGAAPGRPSKDLCPCAGGGTGRAGGCTRAGRAACPRHTSPAASAPALFGVGRPLRPTAHAAPSSAASSFAGVHRPLRPTAHAALPPAGHWPCRAPGPRTRPAAQQGPAATGAPSTSRSCPTGAKRRGALCSGTAPVLYIIYWAAYACDQYALPQ